MEIKKKALYWIGFVISLFTFIFFSDYPGDFGFFLSVFLILLTLFFVIKAVSE